ncbi:DUF1641 domain-containing protein [Persicimonas caeni]|uniref:DUF1641 domain-containing protein n=1 Tax=Persicimonas caeni TaxID=2292766 RepID=A0A4Y6PX47_PERCE|nr:DUF1641 domain-containing protein [Persicimonas caeni]QDG52904.1 DUF1641 domain-containing protein [Persicimonas caeni]QED34126.1 DUF1641 domain-containing protein [Persicimonas caeni]
MSRRSSSNDANLQETLARLDARLARIESALGGLQQATDAAPDVLATVTDMTDAWIAQAADKGVDVDARLRRLGKLALDATDPKVLDTAEMLVERIDLVQQAIVAADQLPGFVAMVTDIFDEHAANAAERGLDLQEISRRMVGAARSFAEFVQGEQFTTLLESGVLDPHAIEVIGRAGRALADVAETKPSRTGLFGMVRAAGDTDIKRSINFMVRFGKRFGQLLRTQLTSDKR